MRVPVDPTSGWSAGTPTKLFSGRFFFETQGPGEGRTYDVSPDGSRFVMVQDNRVDTGGISRSLILVEHFDEELKRFAPTKN